VFAIDSLPRKAAACAWDNNQLKNGIKFRFVCALLAPFFISAAPAEAGNLRGISLPGSFRPTPRRCARRGLEKKLLKTIFRNKPDSAGPTPLSTDGLELYDIPGSAATVMCPKDRRCIIEVTVDLGWVLEPGAAGVSAVNIGGLMLDPDGPVDNPAANNFSINTSWTYVKLVNAGKHTVQPVAMYRGATELWGHSVVIRLYQR
jgi:hypothetical protein